MNWMGGARNRVKYKEEKRIQQEFFERQKLAAAQSISSKLSSKKRKGLSQDLVALHTLSRVHSGIPDVTKKRRPIQKLDLEMFRSCTRQIDEVDMGPCSPSETPSKLLLNDGKLDRNSGNVKVTDREVGTSRELFPKPSNFYRHYSTRNTSTEQDTQIWRKNSTTPVFSVENKIRPEIYSKIPDTCATSKPSNEYIFSKPNQDAFTTSTTVKEMFDPYVSEDFQVTPLVKYTKKRSPLNAEFDKSKKKRHSDEVVVKNKFLDEIKNRKSNNFKKLYFSSTPIAYTKSANGNKSIAKEQFGGISPIGKDKNLSTDVDSGFRFKPRPMISTPVKNKIEGTRASQLAGKEKNVKEPLIDTSLNSSTNQSCEGSPNLQSHISQKYDKYINKYSKNNLNNSEECCKDSIQNDSTRFMAGRLSRSNFQGSPKISGSLGKYRNIFRHKNDKESPFLQRNSVTVSQNEQENVRNSMEEDIVIEAGMSKPKFADIEEEFHYKPMKSIKGGSVKITSDVMNMYEKCSNDKGKEESVESTRTDTRKMTGGSGLSISSPLPGDEFPKHLLSPSEQLQEEIDKQLKKIIAGENIDGSNQDSSQDMGLVLYKPLNTQMDDVLCEMKQLEEQNSMTPEAVLENKKLTLEENKGDVCTESFEADAFLKSNDTLMEAINEHINETETRLNKETTIEEKPDVNVIDKVVNKGQANDEIEVTAQDNIQVDKQLADEQVVVADAAKRDSDDFLNKCEVEKYSDGENITQNSCTGQYKDVKCLYDYQEFDSKESNGSELDVLKDNSINVETNIEKSVCLNVSEKKDGYYSEEVKSSEINSELSDKINSFRNSTENDKELLVSGRPVKVMTVLNQLQVQEISSGKNQSTQTDSELQVFKSFVEVSTSPFKELETLTEMTDIAVQCDLPLIPSLSELAGKCYKVKPIKKSTPLNVGQEKEENEKLI